MSPSPVQAVARIRVPQRTLTATVGATLKRWWTAYMLWRLERMAIAQLESLSDRELADMGLVRVDIPFAVKSWIAPHSALRD